MSEYTKQAEQFLKDTETEFKAEFERHGKHFEAEKEERDIYKITLTKGSRVYEFEFGQSIANEGVKPTAYDVLACLDIFDGDFQEFCDSFGYEEDSRTAFNTFGGVEEQSKQLKILWDNEEIQKLQEIQ